jgi:hypothetical protein
MALTSFGEKAWTPQACAAWMSAMTAEVPMAGATPADHVFKKNSPHRIAVALKPVHNTFVLFGQGPLQGGLIYQISANICFFAAGCFSTRGAFAGAIVNLAGA